MFYRVNSAEIHHRSVTGGIRVNIKPVITFDDVNEIVVSMLRDTRMSMKKGKDMLSRYEIPEGR